MVWLLVQAGVDVGTVNADIHGVLARMTYRGKVIMPPGGCSQCACLSSRVTYTHGRIAGAAGGQCRTPCTQL